MDKTCWAYSMACFLTKLMISETNFQSMFYYLFKIFFVRIEIMRILNPQKNYVITLRSYPVHTLVYAVYVISSWIFIENKFFTFLKVGSGSAFPEGSDPDLQLCFLGTHKC